MLHIDPPDFEHKKRFFTLKIVKADNLRDVTWFSGKAKLYIELQVANHVFKTREVEWDSKKKRVMFQQVFEGEYKNEPLDVNLTISRAGRMSIVGKAYFQCPVAHAGRRGRKMEVPLEYKGKDAGVVSVHCEWGWNMAAAEQEKDRFWNLINSAELQRGLALANQRDSIKHNNLNTNLNPNTLDPNSLANTVKTNESNPNNNDSNTNTLSRTNSHNPSESDPDVGLGYLGEHLCHWLPEGKNFHQKPVTKKFILWFT